MWGGLPLEFEIVSEALEPMITPDDTGRFEADTTSGSWEINAVRLVCDLCTLDSALQNSYSEYVLGGKGLNIN